MIVIMLLAIPVSAFVIWLPLSASAINTEFDLRGQRDALRSERLEFGR